MLKSKLLFAVALPLALYSVAAEAKLYKWVDENGETHYGQTIPPEYAGQKKVQIDHGMELHDKPQPVAPGKPKEAATKTPEEIEQERHDQALLATYANEGEIDDQLNRSLQAVNARISGLDLQMKSAQQDLDGYLKEKAAAEQEHRPVDKTLQELIAQTTQRVGSLKSARAEAQGEADKIRARFEADKQRYRELTAPAKQ
jgi:Domain of unknown function (DUF4124)